MLEFFLFHRLTSQIAPFEKTVNIFYNWHDSLQQIIEFHTSLTTDNNSQQLSELSTCPLIRLEDSLNMHRSLFNTIALPAYTQKIHYSEVRSN